MKLINVKYDVPTATKSKQHTKENGLRHLAFNNGV
jgi:hypothetical protein